MKKIFLISVFVLFTGAFLEAAPLKIGSKVDSITLDVWYKNKPAPIAGAFGKKTIAILFVTTTMPDPLMLGRVEKMADDLKKKNVEIFLVNNGMPKNSTNVPAWKNLTLPVAFDLKSKLFDTIGGQFEKIPFWVVITPEKQIAWRGGISFLPSLIAELESGKYKIEDAVRREKFASSLRELIRGKKFAEAVKSIREEQKFDPANMELLNLKCSILQKRLKDPAAARAAVDRAIAARPDNFKLYEFKLRFLRQAYPQESVLPVLKQIAEKFRNRPDVLMKLINMEMSQSVEQVSPEGLYIVARAAAGASRYRSSQEQGMAVLSFARVLHYCGKPELAEIEAEKAVKILTGRHKKMAEAVRKHFSAINQFSRKIK